MPLHIALTYADDQTVSRSSEESPSLATHCHFLHGLGVGVCRGRFPFLRGDARR